MLEELKAAEVSMLQLDPWLGGIQVIAYPDHFADRHAAWELFLPVIEALHPAPEAFWHHTRVVERSDAMFLTYPENYCLYKKESERATNATEMMRGQWASDLQELKFRHPEFYKLMLEEGQATMFF